MDWVIDAYTAESMLMQYSEWLDVVNLQIHSDDDGRTHEQLVREFIAQRNPQARPRVDDGKHECPDCGFPWATYGHHINCLGAEPYDVNP